MRELICVNIFSKFLKWKLKSWNSNVQTEWTVHRLWWLHPYELASVLLWKGNTEVTSTSPTIRGFRVCPLQGSSVFCDLSTQNDRFFQIALTLIVNFPASRTMKTKIHAHCSSLVLYYSTQSDKSFGKLQGKVSELFSNALHRDEGMETMKLRLVDMNEKYSKHLELEF